MGETIICKNCGNNFSGKFCNICGEKVYSEHDKSVVHFFDEGLHFVTHFEGTLLTSIKTVLKSPGLLSFDYCNGLRKKYFKPLSLFLLLVVIYLLFPFFEGLNMQMKYYKGQKYFGDYATAKIESVVKKTGLTEDQVAEKFHHKSEKVSKFMLVVLLPFTALVFYAVSFKKRKYFFDQMVFAAEINAVYLLWGFLLVPLLISIVFLIGKLFGNIQIGENMLGIIIYSGLSIYLIRAAKRFYGFKWWQSALFTAVFVFAHMFIVYTLYKFLLFVTVINQIN